GQDLLAPVLPVGGVLRDEGGGGQVAVDLGGGGGQVEVGTPPLRGRGRVGEGVHPSALIDQPLHVDLGDGQRRGEALLDQKGPVFRDHVVAGKDDVGGGLPLPGVGVDVAAAQPAGLAYHQLPAVGGFAHQLVGGGQIQD